MIPMLTAKSITAYCIAPVCGKEVTVVGERAAVADGVAVCANTWPAKKNNELRPIITSNVNNNFLFVIQYSLCNIFVK